MFDIFCYLIGIPFAIIIFIGLVLLVLSLLANVFTGATHVFRALTGTQEKVDHQAQDAAYFREAERVRQEEERKSAQQAAEELRRSQEQRTREEERRAYERSHQRFEEEKRTRSEESHRQQDTKPVTPKDDKYYGAILGLKGHVTPAEVRRIYRELVAQYHPDKVNHLGPKLKELAEKEMKDINEAYDYFRRKYGIT